VANCTSRTHNAGVHISAELNPEEEQQKPATADDRLAAATAPLISVQPRVNHLPSQLVRYQEFEFPGVLASVPEYRDKLMDFVLQQAMDEGDQIDILVALQEALANAALHGCKDDPLKKIFCAVTADPVQIVISIRDSGRGFNLERADPKKFETTRLSHGRGIPLIRGLMTEVSFARHGAEIIMSKRLATAP